MFIHDLEFIESGKELPMSSFAVEGGVSASASVSAYTNGSNSIGVTANASASGVYTNTGTTINATLLSRGATPYGVGGYIAGYGNGYAVGYAVDPYGSYTIAFDSDSVTV